MEEEWARIAERKWAERLGGDEEGKAVVGMLNKQVNNIHFMPSVASIHSIQLFFESNLTYLKR